MASQVTPIMHGIGAALVVVVVGGLSASVDGAPPQASTAAAATPAAITFSKDVAPIFQAHCQGCHRPGGGAPFSLVTYKDARPWSRAVKLRVVNREMPPWHVDKRVGIQKYKHDPSLTDAQIETIARWVDAGAPEGNPADLPAPKTFPPADRWQLGTPDFIVQAPREHVMYAKGPDWWVDFTVDLKITEDRWLKGIEVHPSDRRILHHVNIGIAPPPVAAPKSNQNSATPQPVRNNVVDEDTPLPEIPLMGGPLYSYEPNKQPRLFPENTGVLVRAGSRLSLNAHYHAVGEEARDRMSVGLTFYPAGVVPKYKVTSGMVAKLDEAFEVPANSVIRHDAYLRLTKPSKVLGWSPHMHTRGKALTLEAILPNGSQQVLSSVDRYDFNWQNVYDFADDAAPVLPAGTMLHAIFVFDNTPANRRNPDPTKWLGYGQATYEEMAVAFVDYVQLEDSEYTEIVSQQRR